jgi:hypothetical protein
MKETIETKQMEPSINLLVLVSRTEIPITFVLSKFFASISILQFGSSEILES